MQTQNLRHEVERLERQVAALRRGHTGEQREEIERAYARADSVAKHFGETVSGAVPGETAIAYRRRLVGQFQKHSERFKDARLDAFDAATLNGVEDLIYQDAVTAARRDDGHAPGKLTSVTERIGGRDVTKFYGDPAVWMNVFSTGAQTGSFIQPPAGYKK